MLRSLPQYPCSPRLNHVFPYVAQAVSELLPQSDSFPSNRSNNHVEMIAIRAIEPEYKFIITIEPLTSQELEVLQLIVERYSNRAIAKKLYKGEGAASQQSFEQFKQGFANTESTAVEVGEPGRLDGAAGSSYIEIPVSITATTTDGTSQQFRGSYVLRRVNDVTDSTPEQHRWHLYSAKITSVS